MAVGHRLTRRAALGLMLAGCARVQLDALPEPQGAPVTASSRLRVVFFEVSGTSVPFHTGLIVHTPQTLLIYDPAGKWRPSTLPYHRDGDTFRDVSPAFEEAYLIRDGIRYFPHTWRTHVFDVGVTPEIGQRALDRVNSSELALPLHCAYAVSTVLSGLPGFEDIEPHRITTVLFDALLLRDDVTYSRREPQDPQNG